MRSSTLSLGRCILIVMLVVLSACSASGIVVKEPFARPSPGDGGTGGAFMTVVNNSNSRDRLISAACPIAKVVELHETVNLDGVMSMRPQPDGFEIPPKSVVELKPGGKHVMLMGLTVPLKAGETFEVTLNFERAGAITVQVPVRMP